MASPQILLTPRDIDIFQALDRCPLTTQQLLKISQTFVIPFTNERKVRARMQILHEAGRVNCWPLAVAGRGMPNYYTLSRKGYRLLHGSKAKLPTKRVGYPVAIAHQEHTHRLADFIVHTAVVAHLAGIDFTGFCRENTVCLQVGEDKLYPDCAFVLRTPAGEDFHFLVELDNQTERIRSEKDADSWQRKIQIYEAVQNRSTKRFRVLVITTRSRDRALHILRLAREMASNPDRSLFYGTTLEDYLEDSQALTAACFLDHCARPVPLVPDIRAFQDRWKRRNHSGSASAAALRRAPSLVKARK